MHCCTWSLPARQKDQLSSARCPRSRRGQGADVREHQGQPLRNNSLPEARHRRQGTRQDTHVRVQGRRPAGTVAHRQLEQELGRAGTHPAHQRGDERHSQGAAPLRQGGERKRREDFQGRGSGSREP